MMAILLKILAKERLKGR